MAIGDAFKFSGACAISLKVGITRSVLPLVRGAVDLSEFLADSVGFASHGETMTVHALVFLASVEVDIADQVWALRQHGVDQELRRAALGLTRQYALVEPFRAALDYLKTLAGAVAGNKFLEPVPFEDSVDGRC